MASLGKEDLANPAAKILERDFYHYVSDDYEIGRKNLQLKDPRLTYYLMDALLDPNVPIGNKQKHILPLLRRIPDFKVAGTIVGIFTSGQALNSHYVSDLSATLGMVAESAEDHMRYDSYLLAYGSSIPIEWQVERAVKLAEEALAYFRNNNGMTYWSNSWAAGAYLTVKNFLNLKVKRAANPDPKWIFRLEMALAPFEIKK